MQLADDKRLCRRIESRSLQFAAFWAADGDFDDFLSATHNLEELKAQGAQVDWPEWWADQKTHLQQQLRFIATHALRTGHIKSGNRLCNRIINELAQLDAIIPKPANR